VRRAKSAGLLVGVDNPRHDNERWIVFLTDRVIEDVGVSCVSRINGLNDLRNERIFWVITSFPRGISTQVVGCRLGDIAFTDTDSVFVLVVCLRKS
jgi:hypothetical protein